MIKIPKIWNLHEAYISYNRKKIIDYKKNNLHILGYSKSNNKKLFFEKLKKNIIVNHKINPNAIPYATSYYKKNWGFCLSKNQFLKFSKLKNKFKVKIKSDFTNGKLNWGEATIKGKSKKMIIFSTYLCHPSMANNELSGPVVCKK